MGCGVDMNAFGNSVGNSACGAGEKGGHRDWQGMVIPRASSTGLESKKEGTVVPHAWLLLELWPGGLASENVCVW